MHHEITQVYLKRGLKQFKEKGENPVSKELIQLHKNSTLSPLAAGDIDDRYKDDAPDSLMFLKEKRDVSVKGRSCANRRKHRPGSSKENATPPTVLLELVLII